MNDYYFTQQDCENHKNNLQMISIVINIYNLRLVIMNSLSKKIICDDDAHHTLNYVKAQYNKTH